MPSLAEHTRMVLEYPALLVLLETFAGTEPGRQRIRALLPLHDAATIRRLLDETTECVHLLASGDLPGMAGVCDIAAILAQLPSPSTPLEPAELLDLAATLDIAATIHSYFESRIDIAPCMWAHAGTIAPCPNVIAAIRRCIENDRNVKDTASPQLHDLRRRIVQLRAQIQDRLRRLLDSSDMQNIFENKNISMRNGRPVLAVKAGNRQALHGSMLDKSNTGLTVFVEPHAVSELVNDLEDIRFEEAKEVTRILWDLTRIAGAQHQEIGATHAILAHIDMTAAKARFSRTFRMTQPAVADTPVMVLRDARHPLLLHYAQQKTQDNAFDRVVPMTVRLGDDFDLLVVTGPNTGGKTVALKTAGLVALMAQSAMHIPAAPGSTVPVFDGVFADIGDEQSIEQSLSTFSSHMTNIVHILDASSERTLVLLDELGSGTDPAEGAALATAILDHLRSRNARVIATTHLGALKTYAYQSPRTENASMEFDRHSLMPTFRLLVGQPGSSNALAIARRLHMPEDVLRNAELLMAKDATDAAELINKVQQTRVAAEASRDKAEALKAALQAKLAEAAHEQQQARDAAQHFVEYTLRDVRALVGDFAAAARNAPSPWADKAHELERRITDLAAGTPLAALRAKFVDNVQIGEQVFVMSLHAYGEVRDIRRRQRTMRVVVNGLACDVPFAHITEKPFATPDRRTGPATPPPLKPEQPKPKPPSRSPAQHQSFLESLKDGDRVYVPALRSPAVIVRSDHGRKECLVRIGTLDFTVARDKLRPLRTDPGSND